MVNWDEVQKIIFPIKNYEDLCQRLRVSLGFACIRGAYNFKLPGLVAYTERLLRGDSRGRYETYASMLISIVDEMGRAGIGNIAELKDRTANRENMELFSDQIGISAPEIASLLKYLVYWVVPANKYLSGLVRADADVLSAILALRDAGVRTNLELLEAGMMPAGRRALEEQTKLPSHIIFSLVNRADFSRLPWASKATISNIIGAGYTSLAKLTAADPEQLYADFFGYGKSIGKNLKLGNEIENSFRISKILPPLVQQG